MNAERISYKQNIEGFLQEIEGKILERIGFDIDFFQEFDASEVPFAFTYANSIVMQTEVGCYLLHTSMTSSGADTFWIQKKCNHSNKPGAEKQYHEKVLSATAENNQEGWCFKIHLKTTNSNLVLYAAEIYRNATGSLDYKMNDEMILIFENLEAAKEFERLTIDSSLKSGPKRKWTSIITYRLSCFTKKLLKRTLMLLKRRS